MTEADRAIATLDSIGDAILSTDDRGRVTYLNLAAEAMTGWSRAEAAGRASHEVFRILDRGTGAAAPDPMAVAMRLDSIVRLTPNCVLVRRDGVEVAIEDSAAPIHDRDGRVTGAVVAFRHVGVALATSRLMSYRAQYDAVTDLPNRFLLNDRLTEAIAMARRHRRPLAVLFLDVDGFKAVNDSLGHASGDEVLRLIALRVKASVRQSDTVSRYGGDEFVILLTDLEHEDDAAVVAKKLVRAASGPHRVGTRDLTVTASIGIALYPDHGAAAEVLIARADRAMYDAKRAEPGAFKIFAHPSNGRANGHPAARVPAVRPPSDSQTTGTWEGEGGALGVRMGS